MNKYFSLAITISCCFFLLIGCSEIKISPITPTSEHTEIMTLANTTIEIYRDGKPYKILPGEEAQQNIRIAIIWQGDIDHDGEIEIIISISSCGAYCHEEIRLYKYSVEADDYVNVDELSGKFPVIESIEDLNTDGNPELITRNLGFCFQCAPPVFGHSAIGILRYEQGKFIDVTREFPDLIIQDAEHFLELSQTSPDEQNTGLIALASYLYDTYRLGRMEEARRIFDDVCRNEVKLNMQNHDYNCEVFRSDVEEAIEEFEKSFIESE